MNKMGELFYFVIGLLLGNAIMMIAVGVLSSESGYHVVSKDGRQWVTKKVEVDAGAANFATEDGWTVSLPVGAYTYRRIDAKEYRKLMFDFGSDGTCEGDETR